MKFTFIKINVIDEIDLSKISVYDMNNRYIDNQGKLYGLRYNSMTRKVEIINLLRTDAFHARSMQSTIQSRKKQESFFIDDEVLPGSTDLEKNDGAHNDDFTASKEIEEAPFDPDQSIHESIELMQQHSERLKGILMNIQNSNIIPTDNKEEIAEFENLYRNIEIDVFQKFEKAENYYKELTGYPRSIGYYQAKMDRYGRDVIDGLGDNTKRATRFIYFYEMFTVIKTAYQTLRSRAIRLEEYLSARDPEENKGMNRLEKQALYDAQTSIRNTINEAEELLDRFELLDAYVHEPGNF